MRKEGKDRGEFRSSEELKVRKRVEEVEWKKGEMKEDE